MKKVIVIVFLTILYTPLILSFTSRVFDLYCDVELNGYTNIIDKPEFTISSFLEGNFQKDFSSWYETNLKPRGVLTKTYATIQYNCFNLGNRPIGYNKNIFQWDFIDSELCINGSPNFFIKENWDEMKEYVRKLEILKDKLSEYGKFLYIYVTPSKADFCYDDIPQKYKDISEETIIKPVEAFEELIKETSVPYLICSDYGVDLKYPAFYHSGIHWARTFEQEISAQIVKEISTIANKDYREIVLGEVCESSVPYWRDADVYNLMNVWNNLDEKYYEYITLREDAENYDKIKVLIQGTSFSEGLRKDILNIYPYENVYYIFYNNYLLDNKNNQVPINSWDEFDISKYLDNTDVIVLETSEAHLANYSYGFVDYLIQSLEMYQPGSSKNYMKELNFSSEDPWNVESFNGLYGKEDGFVWGKKYCEIILENNTIKTDGLEIDINLPDFLYYDNLNEDEINIFINGKRILNKKYYEPWSGSIYIMPKDLNIKENGDLYDIEIYCSKSFVPCELGINSDDRDLALQIKYIGSVR